MSLSKGMKMSASVISTVRRNLPIQRLNLLRRFNLNSTGLKILRCLAPRNDRKQRVQDDQRTFQL